MYLEKKDSTSYHELVLGMQLHNTFVSRRLYDALRTFENRGDHLRADIVRTLIATLYKADGLIDDCVLYLSQLDREENYEGLHTDSPRIFKSYSGFSQPL